MTGVIATARNRAAFGVVLLSTMAVATFLHFATPVLAPFLTADFGISATQLGLLGTINYGAAALSGPIVGTWVDNFGGRRVAAVIFGLSAITILGFALSPTYAWLVAVSAANGLTTAGANPATNRLLAAYVEAGRRGWLIGIKQSGVRISQFAAGAILPIGALALGWREAMIIAAAACLPGIAAVYLVVPAYHEPRRSREAAARTTEPLGPTVWRLSAFALLMGTGMSAFQFYLPLYAFDRLDFGVQTAGLTVGIIGFLGIFARIAWGPAAERFSSPALPLVVMSIGSIASVAAVWATEAIGIALLWVGVVGTGLTGSVWNTVAHYAIIATTRGDQTGRVSGFFQAAFVTGLSVGPLAFGLVLEATDSYHVGWLGIGALLVTAATIATQWWTSERSQLAT